MIEFLLAILEREFLANQNTDSFWNICKKTFGISIWGLAVQSRELSSESFDQNIYRLKQRWFNRKGRKIGFNLNF